MKVLLLDQVTTQVVAMVYSQSQILEKEVYLVERLDANHEPMQHLKAVCFIRPTRDNIRILSAEVAQPRFAEYHIFFCSICTLDLLEQLAAADEHEGLYAHCFPAPQLVRDTAGYTLLEEVMAVAVFPAASSLPYHVRRVVRTNLP